MKRALVAFALVAAACGPPTPRSPTSTTTTPPTSAPTVRTTASADTGTRWVAVSVATVWTLPSSPRAIDAPALANPAQPRAWLAHLTDARKLDLVGRVQTQVLYGARVVVTETNGDWSRIVVPDQRSQKDARGYPGWVPTRQLSATAPTAGAMVWITVPTLHVADLDLSYGTRLTFVRKTGSSIEVELLDGRHATVPSADVSLRPATNVLTEARKFVGLPYLWGGTSGFGFDCSGLTLAVYRAVGVVLARDTDQQVKDGAPVALRDIRPGDLLFVANANGAVIHEAIFAGANEIIESPRTGLPVRVVPLSTHTYVAARRVLPG